MPFLVEALPSKKQSLKMDCRETLKWDNKNYAKHFSANTKETLLGKLPFWKSGNQCIQNKLHCGLFLNVSRIFTLKLFLFRAATNWYFQILLFESKQQKQRIKRRSRNSNSIFSSRKQLWMVSYEFRACCGPGLRAISI